MVLATLNHDFAPEKRSTIHPAPIVIGRNVWIGASATLAEVHQLEKDVLWLKYKIEMLPKGGKQFMSIWLSFSHNFLRKFYQTLDKNRLPKDAERQKTSVYRMPANRPDITSLFKSMTPYFNTGVSPTDELIQLKLMEGVYVLLNTDKSFYSSLFDFSEPWKIDIFDFLNGNYMYDLSLEEIAAFTGRSLAAFKRDFKKISPLSPQKWLIQKRLETAQEKLRNGRRKMSDICFEVGFKNLSHFSKAYKKTFGRNPSDEAIS